MPKREKRTPRAQFLTQARDAKSRITGLGASKRFAAQWADQLGAAAFDAGLATPQPRNMPRVQRTSRCAGCKAWCVAGTPITPLGPRDNYLCSRCAAPEPPEDAVAIASFDYVTGSRVP